MSVKDILGSEPGTDKRREALKEWNTRHAGTSVFSTFVSETEKAEVLQELLRCIANENLSIDERRESLTTMRLLCREDVALEPALTEDTLVLLMKVARLHSTSNSDFTERPPMPEFLLCSEAVKALVNLLIKSKPLHTAFGQHGGCRQLMNQLRTLWNSIPDRESPNSWLYSDECENILFPLVRLAFSATRPMDSSPEMVTEALEGGMQDIVSDWLGAFVNTPEGCPKPFPTHLHMTLLDFTKIVIALTIDMGPLGAGKKDQMPKYFANFKPLLKSLLKIVHESARINAIEYDGPSEQRPDYPELHQLAVNVVSGLINIPVEYYPVLTQLDEPLQRILESFTRILTAQLIVQDEEGVKGAVPTIMMLALCAKGIPESRPIMLKLLFPNRDLETEEPTNSVAQPFADAKTLGNGIIKLMTSLDMSTKYWSNEYLFQLCGESAEMFLKLTGFGNAAGLFAMRNLFGMGRFLNRDNS